MNDIPWLILTPLMLLEPPSVRAGWVDEDRELRWLGAAACPGCGAPGQAGDEPRERHCAGCRLDWQLDAAYYVTWLSDPKRPTWVPFFAREFITLDMLRLAKRTPGHKEDHMTHIPSARKCPKWLHMVPWRQFEGFLYAIPWRIPRQFDTRHKVSRFEVGKDWLGCHYIADMAGKRTGALFVFREADGMIHTCDNWAPVAFCSTDGNRLEGLAPSTFS